ncbi:MAG: signal recognition particle-docking protein FtsY, partial [Chloroflexi bacterium]|nr:signal recognition particle-docking protein FtsY [Chloroflexota bacterium]
MKMPLFGLFKKTEKAVEKTRAGWFDRVARLFERPSVDATTWEDLEELLILADVGAETAEKLINRVRERAKGEGLSNPASVRAALQEEMVRMLSVAPPARPDSLGTGSPLVVIVAGVNGSGKTTSIAKLANYYKSEGKNVLLVAADTFRAAAIEQLQAWAERVGVDIIAGKQGSDPGAVVYDALQAARSRKSDAVIIDTAGRLHTKFNLMEELKKIKRIAARE